MNICLVSPTQPMATNYEVQYAPHSQPVSMYPPEASVEADPLLANEIDELRRIREMIMDTQNEIQKMNIGNNWSS
jgi:hypothetical protein